jgi:carbonic anhydrase/acetyltransferase-like protein (isoleucine patch superfamily)
VPPDKQIPDGSVVMGSPGRIVRTVADRDLQMIARAAENYRRRAREYRSDLAPG